MHSLQRDCIVWIMTVQRDLSYHEMLQFIVLVTRMLVTLWSTLNLSVLWMQGWLIRLFHRQHMTNH